MLPLKYLAQKFPVSLPVYNTAPVPTPPTDQSHQLLPAADPEDSDQGRVAPDREHHAAVPGQLAQLPKPPLLLLTTPKGRCQKKIGGV